MAQIIIVIVVTILAVLLVRRSMANKKIAEENKKKGAQFLNENASKDGIQTTGSGLQYQVLSEGSGPTHPKQSDRVKVHYHGTLIDGTVFDSSVARGQPLDFGVNQVISGWIEGLQLMVEGEKTRFFIPSDLAYGDRGAGPIPPGSVLIFEVKLLGIN